MPPDQDQELTPDPSTSQDSTPQPEADGQEPSASSTTESDRTLDELLAKEQSEIAELDAKDKENKPEETADETEEDERPDGEVEDYKPNTKYKVQNQEYEFHDDLKGLVDEKTEPILRELYEKAKGLEFVKPKLEQTRAQLSEKHNQFEQMTAEVGRVLGYKQSGDLDSFFESINLSKEAVIRWAIRQAEIAELPPEVRAVYTEREELRKRMNGLEAQVKQATTGRETEAVNSRLAALDTHLAGDSQLVPAMKAFDERNGEGSFRAAVVGHANDVFRRTKQDLSPADATKSFVKFLGLTVQPQTKVAPKPGQNATRRVVAKPKATTIPNFGGSQASALGDQKPKSIADLKKIAKEKFG